jgi:hypothetical protein
MKSKVIKVLRVNQSFYEQRRNQDFVTGAKALKNDTNPEF